HVRLIKLAKGEDALDLDQEFIECSRGLLSWPRTLGHDEEIQRPELLAIIEKIQASNESTTLILGAPGSGKSALLAALGSVCLSSGFSVLGIKADRLGRGIDSAVALRKHLHLTLETRDAVKHLALQRPVVILIDQLDAVSELVDRHSDRLNVLLDLIQSLSGHPGVHIVASSRAFECHHDIRLNSIDADRMNLTLPSWDEISPILTRAGYDGGVIGDSTRDLLRSPLCLKVFLDVGNSCAIFSTLQSLLEALWSKKVLVGEDARDRVKLLESVANKMSKDEVLWVPSSVGDRWPQALQGLVQEDILNRGPNELTIGFRHQTYYDYTLARAFAKGALSLTKYVKERQNGLFVRPVLLNGLQHLRVTDSSEYQRQLKQLLAKGIRLHIHSLLIEFLAGQRKPTEEEFSLILPRLKSGKEGPRILAAIAGSPGWFARMSTTSTFHAWMCRPHDEAMHLLDVLCQASQFDLDGVLNLIERYWLPRKSHDDLSLRVFSYISDWNMRAVNLVRSY
ncbi:MAG: ATP-binding protein, partial [Nitrospira sp.]|nr:ATP-binding protein [Nitrospira sp.]